jgi:hypothetical protein
MTVFSANFSMLGLADPQPGKVTATAIHTALDTAFAQAVD